MERFIRTDFSLLYHCTDMATPKGNPLTEFSLGKFFSMLDRLLLASRNIFLHLRIITVRFFLDFLLFSSFKKIYLTLFLAIYVSRNVNIHPLTREKLYQWTVGLVISWVSLNIGAQIWTYYIIISKSCPVKSEKTEVA